MKKRLRMLAVSLLVSAALATAVWSIMPHRPPGGQFQTTGIVQATEVNLAPKITERIREVRFHEGDHVSQGEIVVVLDDQKRAAQVEQAIANLEVAKAGVTAAAAAIEKAQVRIDDTQRDLGRNDRLLGMKLVAQNDADKAKTAYDAAVADMKAAQAQKILSEAGVKQAEAARKVAQSDLDDTLMHATLSGVVTLRAYEPGEMVPAGSTVLTIVDLGDVWVRVDVEETAVARIKTGDSAVIKIDALPGEEFKGRVSEINSEGEFATQRDVKRGRQDIKTYRVKVKLEAPKDILKQGMTAMVGFER